MTPFRLSSRLAPGPAPPQQQRVGSSLAQSGDSHGARREARPVPWRVSRRSHRGVIEFEQLGSEPLRAVRASLAGGGLLGLSLPRTVHPGERLRVVLRGAGGDDAARAPDAMLILRWFEADGTELLWPVAL